ncbi:MAG TPA: CopD family protein, partial [Gemmatimonadaceae bacterium]
FTQPLSPGSYTVAWRTVAKDDGHPSSGKFTFVVDAASGELAPASATPGVTSAIQDSTATTAAQPVSSVTNSIAPMDVEAPSYVIARWLNFVALITLIGVIAFRFLVVPRVKLRAADSDATAPELTIVTGFADLAVRRAASLGLAASITVIVAAVWRLFAERAVIGGDITLTTVLHSYWGKVLHVVLVTALVAGIAFLFARRSKRARGATGAWIIAAAAAVVLGATSAFSGHAIAAPQYRSTSVALDVLHVLAAGGWLGGLFALATVGVPAALSVGNRSEHHAAMPVVARLVSAFSPIALTLAGIVVATGILAAKMRIGSWSALTDSSYGRVLMIKISFVLLVVAGGAFNWRRMRDALAGPSGGSAVNTFRRSAWVEIAAGILVIAATAVLVATPPPIH